MWLENLFVNTAKCWQTIYSFLQIYHSFYNEKLRVYKLASFMLAYKNLAVFVYEFLRTRQTKLFDVNFEYTKRINKFWGEIYPENCQLFESFYRFQFTFMYLEKLIFLCESAGSVALIFHHNLMS